MTEEQAIRAAALQAAAIMVSHNTSGCIYQGEIELAAEKFIEYIRMGG
jgi:hypothetical protein